MALEFELPSSQWGIITLFFLILIWKKIKANKSPNLPPGPSKLPLIGSMHHLIGGYPHQKMRDLATKYGPMMHLQLGELQNVIISSREAAEKVLKTYDAIFACRPQMFLFKSISYNYTDILLSPCGDYWRQLRKIAAMELLAPKRVLSFRSLREEEMEKLIKLISATKPGSVINLSKMIDSFTFYITSRAICGKIWDVEGEFVSSLNKIMTEVVDGGISFADAYPSIKLLRLLSLSRVRVDRLHKITDKILQSVIDEHRAARNGREKVEELDLVDVLLNLQESGNLDIPLSDTSIKALIMDLFVAGNDTTVTTIEWTMFELLRNPKVMKKAQDEVRKKFNAKERIDEADIQELEYIKFIIKETLRLHPPIPLLVPRECSESCVIDGYDIRVKTNVMINIWAMGRDQKYWGEDANEFKPERFIDTSIDYKGHNYEYIPFGSGRRNCLGMFFGVAIVELALANLLFYFDWELPDGSKSENLDTTEKLSGTPRRIYDLRIVPIAYVPPSLMMNTS